MSLWSASGLRPRPRPPLGREHSGRVSVPEPCPPPPRHLLVYEPDVAAAVFPPRLHWTRLSVRPGHIASFRERLAATQPLPNRRASGARIPGGAALGCYVMPSNPSLFFVAEAADDSMGAGGPTSAGVAALVSDSLQERPRRVDLALAQQFSRPVAALPAGAVLRVGRHRTLPDQTPATVEAYTLHVAAQLADPDSGYLASAMYRGVGGASLLYFFTWFRSRADVERHAHGSTLVETRARLTGTLQERLEIWDLAVA